MKIINFIFCLICVSGLSFAQTPLQFEWAKQMGGKTISNPLDMALDKAGNVYSAGYAIDTIDFDPGPGVYKLGSFGAPFLFVSKLDKAGNFVWAKQVSPVDGQVYGKAIAIDSANNIYLTGHFSSAADFDPDPLVSKIIVSSGSTDVFVMKLSDTGNLLWVKTFSGPSSSETAGTIRVDKYCNIYVSGIYNGVVDFDPSPSATFLDTAINLNGFLCKLDSAGNFRYVKTFDGVSSSSSCQIRAIAIGHDDEVIFGGVIRNLIDMDPGPMTTFLTGVDYDAFVAKLDSAGNFLWAKSWGGAKQDHTNAVAVDDKDNIYVTGSLASPSTVMDPGTGTTVLTDGAFTTKMSRDGKFLWATGVKNANASGISIPEEDKIYTAGGFNSIADFDPGAGIFNLSSMGMGDAYVALCDGNGNFIKAVGFGDTGTELLYGLATNATDVYTLGSFQQTVDFDPGPGVYNLSCSSTGLLPGDMFVQKFGFCSVDDSVTQIDNLLKANGLGTSYQWVLCPGYTPIPLAVNRNYMATSNGDYALIITNGSCVDTSACIEVSGLGINELGAAENKSFVYPNPSSGTFTIDIPKEMTGGTVSICNALGQTVKILQLNSLQTTIDLPQGFYLLKIGKEQRTETIKLIIR